MTRRHVLLLIAANLAVLLAGVIRYPHLMLSPGSLGPGHAALNSDCFACHEPWRGAVAARCTTCHALADIGLRTTQGVAIAPGRLKGGFHAQLITQDCTTCHTAHRVSLASRRSRESFSHAQLRPEARARCVSCHVAPTDRMHRRADADCSLCHTADRWSPASFEHDDYFVLDRRHNKACDTCHLEHDYAQYTCYGCHAHTERRIRAEHREEGIRDIDDCAACHPDAREEHAKKPARTQR
jgi:hypothetical protein